MNDTHTLTLEELPEMSGIQPGVRNGRSVRDGYVRGWGLEILCLDPREYSGSLTAVVTPAGQDADRVRKVILQAFDMSLGTGLGKLAGKVFRIGHLGDFNDLTLMGTLAGVEMGLELAGVPVKKEGVAAAMEYLSGCAKTPARQAA